MKGEPYILKIEGAYIKYDNEIVLEDVHLTVAERDFVGIVGPNGGGKTTLLKAILGLVPLERGTIEVFGTTPAKARNLIGYVPQCAGFDQNFPIRVIDVVLMGRLDSITIGPFKKEDKEAAKQALNEVELYNLAYRPIGSLSGGQLQRVLIARAIVSNPKLLLLDEPTAHVDTSIEREVYELLARLNEKITIILVSHNIRFITTHVNQVICVNRKVLKHSAVEISDKVLQQLYGCDMKIVHHNCHIGGAGACE